MRRCNRILGALVQRADNATDGLWVLVGKFFRSDQGEPIHVGPEIRVLDDEQIFERETKLERGRNIRIGEAAGAVDFPALEHGAE